MKNISIIISSFIFVSFLYFGYKINNEIKYQNKYELIKPEISKNKLVNEWGEPCKEFILDNRKILIYDKGFGWEKFIFVFNPKSNLLISKNIDD